MPNSSAESQNGASSPTLSRSASFNHLPALEPSESQFDVKRTLSETNLLQSAESVVKLDPHSFVTGKQVLPQSSIHLSKGRLKKKDSLPISSQNNTDVEAPSTSIASSSTSLETQNSSSVEKHSKSRSVSSTIATFARKPWKSSSSPSPAAIKEAKVEDAKPNAGSGTSSEMASSEKSVDQPAPPTKLEKSRRNSLQVKNNRISGTFGIKPKKEAPTGAQKRPSLQSLRAKVSLERLTGSPAGSNDDVPPVPQKRTVQLPQLKIDAPRKKDQLWSVFRGLDTDYQKFHSKNSSLKANVLRSSVLPFISRYANHPSNQTLRPEDLDRRTTILNKWWTGLLEVLNGRTSQSLSGVDRPVFLEAIIGIMSRPEWRIPTLQNSSLPVTPTASNNGVPVSRSNTSLESAGTDFLIDSIHHNIRNVFAQNLLSQISYCVDKLSMRKTPASLVTFSGKTCAYAFFFCPGVADVLVRLWNTTPDTLRRVLGGFDMDSNSKARVETSEYISSFFPSTLRALSFTSHAGLVRCLRQKTSPPLGATHVNWSGPWVSRWSGRDTDLFFVFAKHFHILVAGFVPSACERSKYVFVPGLISVHAQILTVLEHTLNKQSTSTSIENLYAATSTTFDDFFDGADASASAISLGTANLLRIMSENRLILLLKDIVTDRSLEPSIKQMFMEDFCATLKVATKKVSLFDHNACFVLFDFVEELVSVIPPYYESTRQPDLLEWDFWLDVCKKMMESYNSLTEVRVFAFIYCIWNEINRTQEKKEALCLGILLNETYFYRYFNHWSPMVRAYFQRLLCWRLARYEGNPSALDIRIYNTLLDRLGGVWNYFLFCKSRAEREFQLPLSTAPCSPAPGRRILIIRNDYHPTSSLFVCLDNIIPPSANQLSAYTRHGAFPDIEANNSRSESPPPAGKKRWKALKTIFAGSSNAKPGEVTPTRNSSDELECGMRDDTAIGGHGPFESENQPFAEKNPPKYTFRFSLQWNDRSRWPSKDRRLSPPTLPLPAQTFIQSLRTQYVKATDSASESVSNSLSSTISDDGSDSESGEMNHHISKSNSTSTSTTAATTTTAVATLSTSATTTTLANDADLSIPKPTLTLVTSFGDSHFASGEEHSHNPLAASKYAGRALAEWALVVCECDNFFTRRRDEGVPSDDAVEIPILGVENFRK
ncbi:hypothetical protein PABG_02279 [Paracoccidioides brasiliensis Pb03]|nr:hypothetical protein PABG_02279 [Paracoccidioides brasiliensis Pb03]